MNEISQDLVNTSVKLEHKGSNVILVGKRDSVVQIKTKILGLLAKTLKTNFKVSIPEKLRSITKYYLLSSFEKSKVQFLLENKVTQSFIYC